MENVFIALQRLPYEDLAWHVEISASNGRFSGVHDFYTYPEELNELGVNFYNFGQSRQDAVQFELGERTNTYCFLLLRAFFFDAVGHAAIEFAMDNNSAAPYHAQASFFIHTEVAVVNRFGQQLQFWVRHPDAPLIWSPYAD